MEYIHYGHGGFEPSQFKASENRYGYCKPYGGLWACPVDTTFGWVEFLEREDGESWLGTQKMDALAKSFRFAVADTANIVHIRTIEDLAGLPRQKFDDSNPFSDLHADRCWGDPMEYVKGKECYEIRWLPLDFEQMVRDGIDGVEVHWSELGWEEAHLLDGWDFDSIVILNPDVVVPVSEPGCLSLSNAEADILRTEMSTVKLFPHSQRIGANEMVVMFDLSECNIALLLMDRAQGNSPIDRALMRKLWDCRDALARA